MHPNAKTCRHLGLCQGNQFMNYPCWLTRLGQIRWGILPSSCRYRPHMTGSQKNVGPNSISSFGEMALGKLPCRSLLMPSSTLYLILTHKSNKPQHACTGNTRQRKNSRRGSCLYAATASAAGLISSASVSKAGHRPGDLSQMGQLSHHPVSPLICSSDVPCAPKRPLAVNTKDTSQLKWPGPRTVKWKPLSEVTIADSTCVATGTQWQDFRSPAANFVL